MKEVWGQGLLAGIQLNVPGSPLVAAALKAGLLILTAGKGDVVRLVPPLVITHKELDQAIDILESCMDLNHLRVKFSKSENLCLFGPPIQG